MMYMQSKLFPWYMAQFRRAVVAWMTLPFEVSESFWTVWSVTMYPEGVKS